MTATPRNNLSRRRRAGYFAAFLAAFVLTLSGTSAASTIAITEMMANPGGTDSYNEWMELFNYGQDAVDMSGWTLKDNSSSVYTFPQGTSFPSGGYLIVAQNGLAFANRWLDGAVDPRVLSTVETTSATQGGRFELNNGVPGDGLYLRDSSSNLVWSLGYQNYEGDAISARAMWLAVNDFTTTNYGRPPQDGDALINRNGTDGTGTLGYEENENTTDPFATQKGSDWASPLAGGYTVIPEPSVLGIASLGLAALLRRRRKP